MTTDTSEKGLERLICTALTGHPCDLPSISSGPSTSSGISGDARGGNGWIGGSPGDYDREYCMDRAQLAAFLRATQPKVATFELKNSLTKQTVEDAVEQYKRDRDPRERLFEFGRCVVHFAVDDNEVRFCTQLKGKASWFLPFNLGWNDGAGNPPNPDGIKTDYLWKRLLSREGLTDILENYAQVVETKEEKSGRKKRVQIWPRFHQLDVVRRLLADAGENGTGRRYLIQHRRGAARATQSPGSPTN